MNQELLQRYIEGNVSMEEVEKVVNWLNKEEGNVRKFMALHKLYDISIMNKQAYDPLVCKNVGHATSFKMLIHETLKIAAIFILLWIGLKWWTDTSTQESHQNYQTVYVPAGQRVKLTLPDQTTVWLNAQSELVYPTDFDKGNRTVKLKGEAYFEVSHSEKYPFVVKTSGMDIEVLGTVFNVISYTNRGLSEVALLKGSINLKTPETPKGYMVKVNERVKINQGKFDISSITDYTYFQWKDGLLCFDNETVGGILQKLQLYFGVKINVVERPELLKLKYTGKFKIDDGVEQVLKVLQLEHKFSYTRDNNLNIITLK